MVWVNSDDFKKERPSERRQERVFRVPKGKRMIENPNNLLNVAEVAGILGVKLETVYAWIHTKQIPHYKIGRLVKFKSKEIEEWIQSKRVDAVDLN